MNIWGKTGCIATLYFAMVTVAPCYSQITTVRVEEAGEVAANWLSLGEELEWGWPEGLVLKPLDVETLERDGNVLGYCFATGEQGFIVVPACRELPPITAYSTVSVLNENDKDGFADLLKDVLAEKQALVVAALDSTASTPQRILRRYIVEYLHSWNAYLADYTTFTRFVEQQNRLAVPSGDRGRYSLDDFGPLLATIWSQGVPYNSFCPMSDTAHCVTGCIATAYSMILNYWQYPVAGFNMHNYFWNGDQTCGHNTPGETLFADYSDSYDWANVLNTYTTSATPAQKEAVAELCYEAGVAINIDYGSCMTMGVVNNVMEAMPSHFGYSGDMHRENRNDYASAEEWFTMLRGGLELRCPILYRINMHAIVCDGWRIAGTNQVHMNYGTGANYTAWYTVDNLFCPWIGCDPMVEYCILDIHPSTMFTVTAPNGAETFFVGECDTIRWDPANYFENVRIELNRNYPAGQWEMLAKNTPNDGEYAWIVSTPITDSARIRLIGAQHTFLCDTSDAPFAIAMPSGCDCAHFDTLLYADHDAYLHAGNPTYNYGRRDSLLAGQSSGNAVYALLHFNLSGLDSRFTIASAICSLHILSAYGNPIISLYRIDDDWIEGAKRGATADSHECCWNWRGYGSGSVTNDTILPAEIAWGTAVIGSQVSDSETVGGTGWCCWHVTDWVHSAVDSQSESVYGIAAYSPSPGWNAWCRFDSRNYTLKPRLRVTGFFCRTIPIQPTVVMQAEDGYIRLHWSDTGAPVYRVYSAEYAGGPYGLMRVTSDTFLTAAQADTAGLRRFFEICAATE
jgi:hypothetical protein